MTKRRTEIMFMADNSNRCSVGLVVDWTFFVVKPWGGFSLTQNFLWTATERKRRIKRHAQVLCESQKFLFLLHSEESRSLFNFFLSTSKQRSWKWKSIFYWKVHELENHLHIIRLNVVLLHHQHTPILPLFIFFEI